MHAVEIRSGTRCASCANDRGKIKGRKGGGPLDEAGVRAVVSPKEEGKEREGGVRYEGRGVRVESRPDAGEKEQHTMHKDGEHCTMPRPHENETIMDPTPTAFVGHAAK